MFAKLLIIKIYGWLSNLISVPSDKIHCFPLGEVRCIFHLFHSFHSLPIDQDVLNIFIQELTIYENYLWDQKIGVKYSLFFAEFS